MNYAQLADLQDLTNRMSACYPALNSNNLDIPDLKFSFLNNVTIVRDDLICGGTKSRFAAKILPPQYQEYVYVSPLYGGGQIALAFAVKQINQYRYRALASQAIIFVKDTSELKPYTQMAQNLGATIYATNNPSQDAQQYVNQSPATRLLVPSGFYSEAALQEIQHLGQQVKSLFGQFDEVWTAVGSGALIKGLQRAQLGQQYFGVCVFQICPDIGKAHSIFPDQPFDQPVHERDAPPFPSASRYDAKIFKYVFASAQANPNKKILAWNVM